MVKLLLRSKHSLRPYCVFLSKRWGTKAGSYGLLDFYVTTVCTPEFQFVPSKYNPFVLVNYDAKTHLEEVCENCIKILKANRKKKKRITVIRGLDR